MLTFKLHIFKILLAIIFIFALIAVTSHFAVNTYSNSIERAISDYNKNVTILPYAGLRSKIQPSGYNLLKPRAVFLNSYFQQDDPNTTRKVLGYSYTFERVGLLDLKVVGKPVFFEVRNYNWEEVVSLTRTNDILEKNPDEKNIIIFTEQKLKELEVEEAKKNLSPVDNYFDGVAVLPGKEKYVGSLVDNYKLLKKGMSIRDYMSLNLRIDTSEQGIVTKELNLKELRTLLDDKTYPKAKFALVAIEGDSKDENSTGTVQKFYILTIERKIIEVPVKPDGYFDFEAVKQQLE